MSSLLHENFHMNLTKVFPSHEVSLWCEPEIAIVKYLKLFRLVQWSKNLLIFLLPLSAGQVIGNNFSIKILFNSFFMFCALCFVSSFNYAINDVLDAEKDRLHKVKQNRPIARGDISPFSAIILGVVLLFAGLIFAYHVSKKSLFMVCFFALLQFVYSLALKKIAGIDILVISILFSLRATSAYTFDKITLSPWYIFTVLFAALLLASGKRFAEKKFHLETKSRKVLQDYTEEQLRIILAIAGAGIIFSYLSWVETSKQQLLLIWGISSVLPILTILIRTYPLILSEKGERPESTLLRDKTIVISGLIWICIYLKAKGYL
jgi:4-hydroxybenzoate polyprenyltransferase